MKFSAIVLSGRVCTGKSTLANKLKERAAASEIKSKHLIETRVGRTLSLRALLAETKKLEEATNGRWLKEAVSRYLLDDRRSSPLLVVDSARTVEQVRGLRELGGRVLHVHLQAGDAALKQRYEGIAPAPKPSFSSVLRRGAEAEDSLAGASDVVIDTQRCNPADVLARVRARFEPNPVTANATVDVLVGGQYGSEGKGNIAHYLAPEYDVLVRVGGPNAGHMVYRHNDKPYTFRQIPSGFLGNQGAMLVIGAGAVIGLETLRKEIGELQITPDNLIIDPQAMIIEDEDVQWEVDNLKNAIGSTAQGIGKATSRKILNRHTSVRLVKDEPLLKPFERDTVEYFASCLSGGKRIMLEGTQGTLLSLHHGFYPHVTSRATSAAACLAEAGLTQRHVRKVIMVCRTYPIRVGDSVTGMTSGYMGKNIEFAEIAARSGVPLAEIEKTEIGSVSKRKRRIAEFDWELLRRALLLNGPTDLALTFADYLGVENQKAYRYEQLTDETQRFIGELEKVSGLPVSLISTAFNERNIVDRRMW